MAAESRRNGLIHPRAGQCDNAPVAERRVDYRESVGTEPRVYLRPSRYHDRARMSLSTERGL